MSTLNRAEFIGKVGKAEVGYSQEGKARLNFSIAVWQPEKDGVKQTLWINCVLFGDRAEKANLGVGNNVYASGKISLNTFTKKDGTQSTSLQMTVDNVQNLEPYKTEQKEQAGIYDNVNIPGEETMF